MLRQNSNIGTGGQSGESPKRLRLHAYRAELSQEEHRHNHAHLSLVLAGGLAEKSGNDERRVGAGMFAIRAGEFTHEVRFGNGGALVASLAISPEEFGGLPKAEVGRWVRGSDHLVRAVIASGLTLESEVSLEDSVWDILSDRTSGSDGEPPLWLVRARDRLIEEGTSIAVLAAEAGVHRVHFSRAFVRAFGLAPTLYRRRVRGLRAVGAAIDGKPAARSAYDCGFADQSHMARVIRHMTGASYKRLQGLGGDVTSVQE